MTRKAGGQELGVDDLQRLKFWALREMLAQELKGLEFFPFSHGKAGLMGTCSIQPLTNRLELSNRSCQVGFVFVLNLNGLKISRSEPNPFIKRVEKP